MSKLIDELVVSGCIKFGNFTLKSGVTSSFYINLRDIVNDVSLREHLYRELKPLIDFENLVNPAIVGVPNGATGIAAGLAHAMRLPNCMVFKEEKCHGVAKPPCNKHHHIVIEDVTTTGGSLLDILHRKMALDTIKQVIIIVDREEGGEERVKEAVPSAKVSPLIKLSQIKNNDRVKGIFQELNK